MRERTRHKSAKFKIGLCNPSSPYQSDITYFDCYNLESFSRWCLLEDVAQHLTDHIWESWNIKSVQLELLQEQDLQLGLLKLRTDTYLYFLIYPASCTLTTEQEKIFKRYINRDYSSLFLGDELL